MGNGTEFRSDENLACYCDTVCYEIFNDCCTDYAQYCGVQKRSDITVKKFNWTCEPFGHFKSNQHCLVNDGIWVISRCADDWSFDRSNCEDLTSSIVQSCPGNTTSESCTNGPVAQDLADNSKTSSVLYVTSLTD